MAADSTQIVVPGTVSVYVAPVGTTAPADATTAPGSGWVDLGYTTPDGTTFVTNPTFNDVRSHQAVYPTRIFKSQDEATFNAVLQQWNTANFEAAFGGGSVTVAASVGTFHPPGPTGSTPKAVILDAVDGTSHYRFVIPKARVRSGINMNLNKTEEARLPVAFAVEGVSTGTDAWYMLTDNVTAFAAG